MVQRAKSRIEALKTESGEWLSSPDDLKNHVQDFYGELFSGESDCVLNRALKGMFPVISLNDREELYAPFF